MDYSGTSLVVVPLSRIQSFAGLKNIQKLKISKNSKLKLEITFKDELQVLKLKGAPLLRGFSVFAGGLGPH